jgi:hopanoid biosynthesis associated protein HpnK
VIRSLVVNADDLGLTVGVNDGICDAHDRGILTSASLFANAPATTDAIRRARRRPSLGIGAHLTLVDGAPTLPPDRVPSLVADDGRFRVSWKSFVLACLGGNVAFDEVERELTAQIDRIRAEGIRLTHLDAHKHIHAFPPLFAITVRLAARFDIPVVRVPYERWCPVCGDARQRQTARRQSLANIAMLPWARRAYGMAAAQGVRVPQFAGRIHTGVMSAESIKSTLRRLRPGIAELMVHPGYVDDALRQTATRLLFSRAAEVDLLCATATRDMLSDEAIELVRHDLTRSDLSIGRRVRNVP